MKKKGAGPTQLELPLSGRSKPAAQPMVSSPANPTPLRVIHGGNTRTPEKLASRQAVVRVLVEAGADLLLRRISSARAQEIERFVDQILALFDQVDDRPALLPLLRQKLDQLELLMTETRAKRARRSGGGITR